jgi:predicted GNAT superfamily acetyltransferase
MPRGPWERVDEAAAAAGIEVVRLTGVDDGDAVNRIIERTWGGQHLDREIVRALGFSGNTVLGARAGSELIGFALGWAGVDDDGLHVHSHMLATVPDARHRGVGFALKLAQRAEALERGITSMRWTFDPMIARNAWFNLGKLGAVADRFYPDFYGEMTDAINAGERSDRLVIRWDLEREPGPRNPGRIALEVPIPTDHETLRREDPVAAAAKRTDVSDRLAEAMARGLEATAFSRERSAYLLTEPVS